MTADGTRFTAHRMGRQRPPDAAAPGPLSALDRIVPDRLALVRTEFGRFGRQVSGYSLEHLLPEHGVDVARFMAGTEGTLAVTLGTTVRLVAPPPATVLVVLGYSDMVAAAEAVPAVLPHHPVTAEDLDARLVDVVRRRRGAAAVPDLPGGAGWLFVELGSPTEREARVRRTAGARATWTACSTGISATGVLVRRAPVDADLRVPAAKPLRNRSRLRLPARWRRPGHHSAPLRRGRQVPGRHHGCRRCHVSVVPGDPRREGLDHPPPTTRSAGCHGGAGWPGSAAADGEPGARPAGARRPGQAPACRDADRRSRAVLHRGSAPGRRGTAAAGRADRRGGLGNTHTRRVAARDTRMAAAPAGRDDRGSRSRTATTMPCSAGRPTASCSPTPGPMWPRWAAAAAWPGTSPWLPAVRALDEQAIVLADGFSCRTQLEQLSTRRGLHLAELLARRVER